MLACWWVVPGPSQSRAGAGLKAGGLQLSCQWCLYQLLGEAGLAARAGSLVGGSGILGQVSVPWWMELGPRISDCRGLGFLDLVLVH